jgi:hypothetical protein
MNLPDSALTFLDAFRGILSDPELREAYANKLPMVHCHCFTRELELEAAKKDIFAVRDLLNRSPSYLTHARSEPRKS